MARRVLKVVDVFARRLRQAGLVVGSALLVAAVVLAILFLSGGGSPSVRVAAKPPAAPAPPAPCPAAPAAETSPTQPGGGLLVPHAVSALRICRYSGLNDTPRLALITQLLLTDASRVAALRDMLNRLQPFPSVVMNCPNDNGSQLLLSFDSGDAVPIGLTGCPSARSIASAGPTRMLSESLRKELLALVPSP